MCKCLFIILFSFNLNKSQVGRHTTVSNRWVCTELFCWIISTLGTCIGSMCCFCCHYKATFCILEVLVPLQFTFWVLAFQKIVGKKHNFPSCCCPEPWLQNSSVSSNKGTFCWGDNLLINRGQPCTQVSSQQQVIFVCVFFLTFSKWCCCSHDHKDDWNTYCFGNHQCLWATCHYIHFSESSWPQD